MYLSLHNFRKIIKSNKSAQGSLIAVVLGSVLLATIVASGTSWYLTMRNNLGNTEDKLEAQTIAQSEWERLSHMSLDELEANRNNFKTPYSAGTGSQFTISVNLGEKGTFNNGTCGAVSGGYANCFKNTTITVYRDGSRMFTTRTLPLMAGDYTRKEIDSLLASMKNDYTSKNNSLSSNLTSNYYTKTQAEKRFVLNHYQNGTLAMGWDGSEMHTFFNGSEIDGGGGAGFPNMSKSFSTSAIKYGSYGAAPDTSALSQYATFSLATDRFGWYSISSVKFNQNTWCRSTVQSSGYHSGVGDHGMDSYTSGTFYTWAPYVKGVAYPWSVVHGSFAADGSGLTATDLVCYPAK